MNDYDALLAESGIDDELVPIVSDGTWAFRCLVVMSILTVAGFFLTDYNTGVYEEGGRKGNKPVLVYHGGLTNIRY